MLKGQTSAQWAIVVMPTPRVITGEQGSHVCATTDLKTSEATLAEVIFACVQHHNLHIVNLVVIRSKLP